MRSVLSCSFALLETAVLRQPPGDTALELARDSSFADRSLQARFNVGRRNSRDIGEDALCGVRETGHAICGVARLLERLSAQGRKPEFSLQLRQSGESLRQSEIPEPRERDAGLCGGEGEIAI